MQHCGLCDFVSSIPFTVCPRCNEPVPPQPDLPLDIEAHMPQSLESIPLEAIRAVRTETGLDCITGYGIPQDAVVLLWGVEGSGKSRLALCTADGWCEHVKGRALYLLMESMSLVQLRRMAHEHNVRHLWAILPSRVGHVNAGVYLGSSPEARLYVIDSIQDSEVIVEARANVRGQDCVLALAQATKDGDFRGDREMAHEADVVIELVLQGNERHLNITKNRFGDCGLFPCAWPPR